MAEYTLDLAKLGGSFAGAGDGQESGVTMPDGKVSVIGSEDDGPADFTLNLEKWIKGSQQWRKMGDEVELDAMQPRVEDANGLGDESVFAPLGTSTPAADRCRRASVEDDDEVEDVVEDAVKDEDDDEVEVEEEHGRPMSPALTRHNTQTLQDRAAEEVFSQISALQEEVERLRLEAEDHLAEKADFKQDRLQFEKDYDDLRHDLEDAKASVISVEEKASANVDRLETALQDARSQSASESKRADQGWQAAERGAQAVERAAQAMVEMEKAKAGAEDKAWGEEEDKRRGNLSNVASLRAKFEPLVQELDLVKAEAESAEQKADTKIATLEAKLKVALDEAASLKNQALEDQQAAASDVEKLRGELQNCRNELQDYQKASETYEQELTSTVEGLRRDLKANHESTANVTVLRMELENAQEQLSETRRILETVEDENDRLTQSEDRHKEDIATQNASLEEAQQQLEDKGKEIQEAKSTIENLHADLDRVKAEKGTGTPGEKTEEHNDLAQLKNQHKSDLAKLEEQHNAALKTLKATLLRAGEGMKNREQRIALLHRDELASLHRQLSLNPAPPPKAPNPAPNPAADSTLTDLRAAIRALSRKLQSAQSDLGRTHLALASARRETQDVRAANEAVNAELERRFETACGIREEEWRRRVELLLRERERMAKALLWGWGREEVGGNEGGEGTRQGYRYRFVKR